MSSLQATEQVEEVMPTTVDQDAQPTSTPENQPVPYPHEKPDYNDPKYAGMSKRAIKRQFKQERWDATRDQRRDANKAKKKKKLELKRKMIEDGFLERGPPVKRIRAEEQVWSKLNVVIDCDFNSYMMEKEINSMQTQIGRCYTANRNSINPCPLTVTSFGGELQKVLDKKTPSRVHWKGIEFTSDSYLDRFEKDKLVYLSADSDNVAFELDENKVYIIGGIVDKNRHKGLCQKKAEEQGIPTAQLPIGEYLQLATRKVLTVNHVYDIMLKWLECKDWNQAFLEVIPQRKLKLTKETSQSESVGDDDDDKADYEDDEQTVQDQSVADTEVPESKQPNPPESASDAPTQA